MIAAPEGIVVVRPSSLPQFPDCPRRWAARHIRAQILAAGYTLREIGPTVGATVGSAVHAGATVTLRAKRANGGDSLGPADEAIGAALAEFDARAEEEGTSYDDTTANRNVAQRQITRMVDSYRTEIAPQITPLAVEERLEADIGDGMIVSGQIDALAAEEHRLRDLKTGRSRRPNGAQYGAYSLLFRAHGHDIRQVAEDFIARAPVQMVQPAAETHLVPIDVAEQDAVATIAAIKVGLAEFDRRLAAPSGPPPHGAFAANPMSQLCSPKYCPAYGSSWCRSHLGAK